MAKILISSCLLGFKVRYNGSDMPVSDKNFEKLCSENQIIPFCPEVSAGLEIPRLPAEVQGGDGTDVLSGDARVLCNNGFDVTDSFLAGAKKSLGNLYQRINIFCSSYRIKPFMRQQINL